MNYDIPNRNSRHNYYAVNIQPGYVNQTEEQQDIQGKVTPEIPKGG